MVTIITEKLQNQTLDDVHVQSFPVPIPRSSGPAWSFSTSGTSAFKLTGPKAWNLFADNLKDTEMRFQSSEAGKENKSVHISLETPAVCTWKQFLQSCAEFDSQPNTPPAPPKKRHCRSLSIPGDCKLGKKWQPQASNIWRPVALRPHMNNNKLVKNRNSPLGVHRPLQSTSPLGHSQQHTGCILRPLSKSEDLYCTPPESPVPRPASASSGIYESSLTSLSSAPNQDPNPLYSSNNNNNNVCEPFRIRSLSMEEPISRTTCGDPVSRTICGSSKAAGSMPVIPGSHNGNRSTPSSPHRQRVPRCRSQPCVFLERKCLKRRRDEERPALDFLKMTETAYDRSSVHRPKCSHPWDQNIRSSRSLASLFTEPPECVVGLKTIASSPLDNNLPNSLTSTASIQSITHESRQKQDADSHSDSGCSNKSDPHDTATFANSEENSCGCDEDNSDHGNEEAQVFDLEINNDLDIDQIEKEDD